MKQRPRGQVLRNRDGQNFGLGLGGQTTEIAKKVCLSKVACSHLMAMEVNFNLDNFFHHLCSI